MFPRSNHGGSHESESVEHNGASAWAGNAYPAKFASLRLQTCVRGIAGRSPHPQEISLASLPTHVTLRQLLKRVKSLPKIGAVGEQRFVVEPKHAIDFADQEMPAVLCTPWLIWFLEHAARQAVLPCLEVMAGAAYSNAYLEFLRALVTLRTLNISEESLRDLWHLEKKLLQLIHVDSAGSPTWFCDGAGTSGLECDD